MKLTNLRLPPWLAYETTIYGLLPDGEERDNTGDSSGKTAQQVLRSDFMMVGLTTDNLRDK